MLVGKSCFRSRSRRASVSSSSRAMRMSPPRLKAIGQAAAGPAAGFGQPGRDGDDLQAELIQQLRVRVALYGHLTVNSTRPDLLWS